MLFRSQNFIEGYNRFKVDNNEKYAIDMNWKSLQKKDKWFCYYKKMAQQYPGYSDVLNNTVQNSDFIEKYCI